MKPFKVGDRVLCLGISGFPNTKGLVGKVVRVTTTDYLVDFGPEFDGHNDGGSYRSMTCLFADPWELRLAKTEIIKKFYEAIQKGG